MQARSLLLPARSARAISALPERSCPATLDRAHAHSRVSKSHDDQCAGRRQALSVGLSGLLLLVSNPSRTLAAEDSTVNPIVAFWKGRQSQNGGIKLLAPLRVARRRLDNVQKMLELASTTGTPVAGAVEGSTMALTQALQEVRAASLNCYIYEAQDDDNFDTRASLFQQTFMKSKLSDPCTLRIVVKNAVDFRDEETQSTAFATLDSLLLSYQKLDSLVEMAREGSPEALIDARKQVASTIQIAGDLETLVTRALGLA